jgi:hypothetical protein
VRQGALERLACPAAAQLAVPEPGAALPVRPLRPHGRRVGARVHDPDRGVQVDQIRPHLIELGFRGLDLARQLGVAADQGGDGEVGHGRVPSGRGSCYPRATGTEDALSWLAVWNTPWPQPTRSRPHRRGTKMLVIWLGMLLLIGGLVLMAGPPIWRGRLSGRRPRSPVTRDTLERREPGAGFGLARNWPGIAMVALGAILLLAGAVV